MKKAGRGRECACVWVSLRENPCICIAKSVRDGLDKWMITGVENWAGLQAINSILGIVNVLEGRAATQRD